MDHIAHDINPKKNNNTVITSCQSHNPLLIKMKCKFSNNYLYIPGDKQKDKQIDRQAHKLNQSHSHLGRGYKSMI